MSYESCRKRTQSTISADGQVVQFRLPIENCAHLAWGSALPVVPTFVFAAAQHRAHSPQLPRGHNWFSVVYITHPPRIDCGARPLGSENDALSLPSAPAITNGNCWGLHLRDFTTIGQGASPERTWAGTALKVRQLLWQVRPSIYLTLPFMNATVGAAINAALSTCHCVQCCLLATFRICRHDFVGRTIGPGSCGPNCVLIAMYGKVFCAVYLSGPKATERTCGCLHCGHGFNSGWT